MMNFKKTVRTVALMVAAVAFGLALEAAPGTKAKEHGRAEKGPDPQALAGADAALSQLQMNEEPMENVLQNYANRLQRTLLIDPSTDLKKSKVTLKSQKGLSEEEYRHALEVILELHGIHVEPYGEKFLKVMPRKSMRKEGVPLYLDENVVFADEDTVVSFLLRFHEISADVGNSILKDFQSEKSAPAQVLKNANAILVTDTKQNINRMRQILKIVDRQPDTKTPDGQWHPVVLRYATAANVEKALRTAYEYDKKRVQELNSELEKKEAVGANRGGSAGADSHGKGASAIIDKYINPPKSASSAEAAAAGGASGTSPFFRGLLPTQPLFLYDAENAPNKILIFTTEAEMKTYQLIIDELDVPSVPDKVVKVYRLKYAEAKEVADMITDLINKASGSRSSGSDKKVSAAKGGTGGKTAATAASRPAGAKSATGEAKIGELTPDNTQVLADDRINGLVVQTMRTLVPTIEEIIEKMDVKLSQVLIETCIIEVTLGDDLNTGIDWVKLGAKNANGGNTLVTDGEIGQYALGGGGGDNASKLFSFVATNAASYVVNPTGSGLNYFLKSDKLNLGAIINASKTDTRSKYIASPIVMTVDNKEATIEATDSKQFLTGWTSVSSTYSGSSLPSPNYSAKDIGIKVKVTPKINPNGTVMLKVEEEYSQAVIKQTMLSPVQDHYEDKTIDVPSTRKMSSDVVLENGQTVVFGGLTETAISESQTGIPILKDIPWIGKWLFGKVTQDEDRKELLVFMTPYVLDDAESAQLEALRRKKALSDPRPWEDHGWSASALADPVSKTEQLRRLKDEWKKQDQERKTKLAIESEKLKRVKALEKMTEEERNFWLEQHKEELDEEQQEELEEKMLDEKSQAVLKKIAEEVRARKTREAKEAIEKAEKEEKEQNEREKREAAMAEEGA